MFRNNLLNAAAGLVVIGGVLLLLKKNRKPRRYSVRPLNRARKQRGQYQTLFLHMKLEDHEQFFIYTMSVPLFNKLLDLVHPFLTKRSKKAISSEERLAITLHYLSQGVSQQAAAWPYNMGKSTVHKIVTETCQILWDILTPIYVRAPDSEDEWKQISREFEDTWNFPHCIGAVDGKHVTIQAPAHSGSQYFNYKKQFSIVLMAACNAKYIFTLVDVGAYRSASDGGVFKESGFGRAMHTNLLNVPKPSALPGTDWDMPYCFVADEAFPLNNFIMRPYPGSNLPVPQLIFNYRLSRARRTIENAFGIMVARWRILKQSINCKVENVEAIVKACIALHNFIKINEDACGVNNYCRAGYVDSEIEGWRAEGTPLISVGRLSANNAKKDIYTRRNNLRDYFITREGELEYQYSHVLRGSTTK